MSHNTSRPSRILFVGFLGAAALISFGGPIAEVFAEDAPIMTIKDFNSKVRVEIDGKLFTEYIYRGFAKPILYPVLGPNGIEMTRNFPMKDNVAGEAADHPHHKSLWFAHGDINGVDFWGEDKHSGRIVHDQRLETRESAECVTIQTRNKWLNSAGNEVCCDTTTLTFSVNSGHRAIDWEVTIHASRGDITFGDSKEGMMSIRRPA